MLLQFGSLPTYQFSSCVKFECIPRHFTKRVCGLHNLSYEERLLCLKISLLSCRRSFLFGCFIYNKLTHNLTDMPFLEADLQLSNRRTRASSLKLVVPRPFCTLFHNFFIFKAVNVWNSLSYDIINCQSFLHFALHCIST